jgi:hypothetical protein
MGAIIFAAICWYVISGKDDPKVRRKVKGAMGTIPKLIAGFFLLIPATVAMVILAATIGGLFSAFGGLIPFIFIAAVISKIIKSGKKSAEREKNVEYQEIKRNVNQGEGYKLTRSTSKRVRIVSKFNKKFNLNLTDDQIERIMNASYVSYYWEKEIYDMTQDYSVQAQWLKADTDWLRAYLMAFPVMDIASDFSVQREIVKSSYFQIFKALQDKSFYSVDEMIKEVNNRFLVNFNEMTLMIAFKFLKENGYNFELPQIGVMRNESDVERLARQYDKMDGMSGTNIPLAR